MFGAGASEKPHQRVTGDRELPEINFGGHPGLRAGGIVVKSDQEPAIRSAVPEVGRVRAAAGGGRHIVETSSVGSSASSGIVERAIRSVQQQVRVMRTAVEERTGAK